MIPGEFKSNDLVSAHFRGLTGAFFVSADSKGVTSVDTGPLDSAGSRKTVTPDERTRPGEYESCRRGPWTFALLDSAWGAQGKRYTAKRQTGPLLRRDALLCSVCPVRPKRSRGERKSKGLAGSSRTPRAWSVRPE